MNTTFDDDLCIDETLRERLVRVGRAIDTAPASVPTAEVSAKHRTVSWIRGTVVAVVAAVSVAGAVLVAGQGTGDPIVGVIPKGLKVSQIQAVGEIRDAPSVARQVSLVNVDGIEVVIRESRARSDEGWRADSERVVHGIRVFLSHQGVRGASDTLVARWSVGDGDSFVVLFPKVRRELDSIVDRLVKRSTTQSFAGAGTGGGVTRVASWLETSEGTIIQIAGSPLREVVSMRSAIPSRFLNRIDLVARPWSKPRFRYGDFVVTAERNDRNVRPLRRSELRTLIKQVDKRQSATVGNPSWKPVGDTLEAASVSETYCVRSARDVACGPYQLNRIVDDTWVRVAFQGTEVIRVDGKLVRSYDVEQVPKLTVFVFPKDAKFAEVTVQSGPEAARPYTIWRPEI